MRVLFEASWWVHGPISNQQVLHQIVRTWIEQFPQDEITLAVRHSDVEKAMSTLPSHVTVVPLRLRPQGLSAILEIPRISKRLGADVAITHNFTPLRGRSAVFIHDVLFLTNPEWFTLKERAYFSLMPRTARRASAVLTSSRSEADRITRHVSGAKAAIAVGLAVNPLLKDRARQRPKAALIPSEFALTVGRLNVRKNLELTCMAAIQSGRFSSEFPLVVAGSFHGKTTTISPVIQDAIDSGSIVLTGFVTDEELAWLYSNAAFFIFMSLDEGFGLPPLEALSLGADVVASDIPVMREVLSGNAEFVDPNSLDGLAESLKTFAPDNSASARQSRADYANTAYSWSQTVKRIRDAVV